MTKTNVQCTSISYNLNSFQPICGQLSIIASAYKIQAFSFGNRKI